MRTMVMGEYYVWYCDWCDSKNLTPWTRASGGKVCCGGCHKEFPVSRSRRDESVAQEPRQAYV